MPPDDLMPPRFPAGRSMSPGPTPWFHWAVPGSAAARRRGYTIRGPRGSIPRTDGGLERWLLGQGIRRDDGGGGQSVEWSFDTIDHGWLIKFIEHRIADRRVLRLTQK